jgi:hypothetical protein
MNIIVCKKPAEARPSDIAENLSAYRGRWVGDELGTGLGCAILGLGLGTKQG